MTLESWRILIVDDSPDDRAEVRRMLLRGSERRFTFVEADHGAAGIAAIDSAPDCMILDFNMPDMNALDILDAIGGIDGTRVPVIVLTGSIDERSAAILGAGAQDYLGKAWMGPEILTRAVDNAIERWRLARDLRRSEEQLQAADRAKNEFLATLAHELRNPLAPLRSGVALLREPGAKAEVVDRTLAIMNRQLEHMVHLIDDLLDVSRISRGKIVLQRTVTELAPVLREALDASRPFIEGARHTLTVAMDDSAMPVDVDVTRIAQVVVNLLNNAAKYTPDGGAIRLSARPEGGSAVIVVEDNGAGIASEMLPKVFDMFAQVPATRDRAQGGLGIGLSIVRNLVELHGGSIEAESDGASRGSTFTVRLPLAAKAVAATAVADKPPATQGKRVLVVDDNVDAATGLSMLLELRGHSVVMAHDGEEAIATAIAFKPDTVFLDLGLPIMDGYEVARRLRAVGELAGMKIIALTGWGSAEDKTKTREASFDGHLTKPVGLPALEAWLS